MNLPFANVDALMRRAKVERLGKDAVNKMTEILEKIGIEITQLADACSKHANRNTIKAVDVDFAFEMWKKQK